MNSADPSVLDLASDEYMGAVQRDRLPGPVVSVVFQDVQDGKARSLSLFVKRARGLAARWLVERRAERAEALQDAELEGYRFEPGASDARRWVFRRPQPPRR